MNELRRPTTVGDRILYYRKLKGLSQRRLAELAGMDHRTLGRIENGQNPANNRHHLAAVASALECSTSDLTGQPAIPTDRASVQLAAAVHGTVQAVLDTDLDLPSMVPGDRVRPLPDLAETVGWLQTKQLACEFSSAAPAMPELLLHLHAHLRDNRAEALRGIVLAARQASVVLKCLGHPAQGWVAAERAGAAATALGDPLMLGLAAWARGHAATSNGSYARARLIADGGLEALRDASGPEVAQMRGALHLLAGWAELGLGHQQEGEQLLRHGETIAESTGPGDSLGLAWGPTNTKLWYVNAAVEGDDPARAVEIAARLHPEELPASRKSVFYLDLARALTALGQDTQALRMLLAAERAAPQRIRASPLTTETVRALVERRSRSDASGLHALAERVAAI